jgi:undecaprenyl-phosphate galactose phosphotransferase
MKIERPDTIGTAATSARTTTLRSGARRRLSWVLVAGDVAGLVVAWAGSLGLLWLIEDAAWRQGLASWWATLGERRLLLAVGLFGVMLFLFAARGHYSRRRPFSEEVLDIFRVFVIVAVLDAMVVFLAKWEFSRLWFLASWLLGLALLPPIRNLLKRQMRRRGMWQRPTAILGVGENATEAAEAVRTEPLMGLEVRAFLVPPGETAPDGNAIDVSGNKVPVVPLGDDLDATLARLGHPQVMVALEADALLSHQRLIQQLSARDADMSIIPPLRGLPLYGMEITHFFRHEVLMLTVRNNLARRGPQLAKRAFDILGAVTLLVALSPLFAFLSWKIRQSGGPATYGHQRVGRDGRVFTCLKFRTMVPDADRILADLLALDSEARAEWERDFKLKNDPRVTPIGDFLRRTSLDELPQLWNVLKGEMSLVGPRPIVEPELERYGDQVGYYLEARPGMTGLWQISGRSETGYEDRVALDSWYVRNWALWYDLVILIKTVKVVLRGRGAY